MKPSALNSNKYPSSYDQPSDDLIKFPLLQSPDYYSHESKFAKRLLSVNHGARTLLVCLLTISINKQYLATI